MIGYIYDTQSRKIATKITDVSKCNDTTIKSECATARIGTGQYIITDQDFGEGDIIPVDIIDKRAEIPVLSE